MSSSKFLFSSTGSSIIGETNSPGSLSERSQWLDEWSSLLPVVKEGSRYAAVKDEQGIILHDICSKSVHVPFKSIHHHTVILFQIPL